MRINKKRSFSKARQGFTLIELLVVVAIIGLLASIVLTSLTAARVKAKDSRRAASLQEIQKALELYANDHAGNYPAGGISGGYSSICPGPSGGWGPGGGVGFTSNNLIPGLVPAYMPSMAADVDMDPSNYIGCLIYVSDGTNNYKLFDYNIPNTSNLAPFAAVNDPRRNLGTPWANNTLCPVLPDRPLDIAYSLAIWSGTKYVCS